MTPPVLETRAFSKKTNQRDGGTPRISIPKNRELRLGYPPISPRRLPWSLAPFLAGFLAYLPFNGTT
jgi:hypothetical protein